MIVHPEERVADFAKAGSDIISVHAEPAATVHLDRTINQVTAAALRALLTCLHDGMKLEGIMRKACAALVIWHWLTLFKYLSNLQDGHGGKGRVTAPRQKPCLPAHLCACQ